VRLPPASPRSCERLGPGEGRVGRQPQLDYHSFAPQLVWLAIAFLALYLVMSRLAVPAISDTLEKRQAKIQRRPRRGGECQTRRRASLIAEYQKRWPTPRAARKLIALPEADSSARRAAPGAARQLGGRSPRPRRRITNQRDES